jgi:RNA polymerase sigma-70 factor (ECF subfamily)
MPIIDDIEAAVPALHRYARSLVPHRHDADDLVQDCLVRAFSRLPAEGAHETVLPWLFTILHNLSVSRWRMLRRRGQVVAVDTAAADPRLSVPATQESASLRRDLLRGFEQLSPEHQQILLLVSVEGLEYQQAATVLKIPVGTVMSRLSRARDALRAQLNGATRPHLRRIK